MFVSVDDVEGEVVDCAVVLTEDADKEGEDVAVDVVPEAAFKIVSLSALRFFIFSQKLSLVLLTS